MIAPENSIPVEVLDAAINAWFGTVPESKDQQEFFRNRMRAALAAAGYPTAPADGDARIARDAAFEAVRKRLCAIPRYSFYLDDDGVVRRVEDRSGSWIEFDAAHELFDPVAVDAALSAQPGAQKEQSDA